MAEAILCEVAKTIIEKLGSGAYKKLVYAKDLDSHITSLQELKTTIEATLVDAETLETCSNSQQDVLNKLRTALAELDDFLDEQADKVELKQVMRGNKLIKPVRLFFSESNQLVSPLRDATKLKTILKKFDCIARNHAQFGSIVSSPSLNQSRGRGLQMATSSILHNLVVGREGDRNNIVSMLSEDSMTTETVSVDSIFGIDGMGKTTLARYVFNDQRVKGCFDAHFWVSVTPDFNVEAVLRKIIDCGSRIKASNLSSCYKLISKFQSLKVLDLNGVGIKELPTSVGDLFCLRFLNLTGTDIVKLPNSITKLVALQSLYLRDCPNLEELPRDISKLENLRHLLLQGSEKLSRMPMGLGNLTNLRTLDVFIVSEQMANVGNLADLKRLGNLGRELSIIVHRESKYITSSEISSVNLKMKGKLKDLYIDFKNGTKEDERVLEGLQPPSNLKVLSIAGYGGERLPGWMMDQLECCLPNLHAICIRDCKACRYLCSFGRLPYLDFLCLKWCDNVEYIEDNTSSSNANNSDNLVDDKLPPAPLFPSLVTLEVYGMPKLKGWWRMSSSRGEQDSKELLQVQRHQNHNVVNRKPTFLALFMLIVFYVKLAIAIARQQIHNFTSLSVFSMPKLKGRWRIWLSGDEDSRELIQVQSHHLDNWKPAFPKLDILTVEIVELAIIITRRQIHNFTSLKHLRITNDWNVGQSDPQRQALTLRSSCFSNLHSLRFRDNKELELLPENFQDLFLGMSSLKELRFESCEQLKAIPEWIDNLTSLTMLSLTECPRLESLPQQISNLPNLKTLQICACPILTERGKKREYWPFIKHIPQIFTD
ncbi:hypothetical protein SOVF_153920 [Spinacia oleracea]|nr:hypothetical protein SOVF_153920 [Spinacia oleracea]